MAYPPESGRSAGRPRARNPETTAGSRGRRYPDSGHGSQGAGAPAGDLDSPGGRYPGGGQGYRGERSGGSGSRSRPARQPPVHRDEGYGGRGYRERADRDAGNRNRSGAGHARRDASRGPGDRGNGYRSGGYGSDWYGGDGYGSGYGGDRDREGYQPGGYRAGTATRERPARVGGRSRRATAPRPDLTGGADGNERLTGMTGAVLLILFAAEGFTILAIRQLLTLHFFLGMLLVGPVILKASSTTYRFIRYYTGAPDYKRKGPPAPLLRLLGPFVLLLSLSVVGTGIMLAIAGPKAAGMWLLLHKGAFVLWFGAMTIHVLAYVWRLPRLVGSDLRSHFSQRANEVLGGRRVRWLLLTAAVLTGLLLALSTVGSAHAWFGYYGISG